MPSCVGLVGGDFLEKGTTTVAIDLRFSLLHEDQSMRSIGCSSITRYHQHSSRICPAEKCCLDALVGGGTGL